MLLEYVGEPDFTAISLIKQSIYFYARKLLPPRIMETLAITIEFDTFSRRASDAAYVMPDGIKDKIPPNEFIININKELLRKSMIHCLAHEMIHVKQYCLKELVQTENEEMLWNGVFVDENEISYHNLPWEKEAREKTDSLYENFMKMITEE